MDRAAVLQMHKPASVMSREDTDLWARVHSHLNDDMPIQVAMLRPWRWLNTRKRSAAQVSGQTATIHYLPGARRNLK